jgi:hypothetical protein
LSARKKNTRLVPHKNAIKGSRSYKSVCFVITSGKTFEEYKLEQQAQMVQERYLLNNESGYSVLIIRNIIRILASLLLMTAPLETIGECLPAEGDQAAQSGDRLLAFSKYKDCDDHEKLSGETLVNMAVLYMMSDVATFEDERSRAIKVDELLKMSAYKGNEDAIVTLASFYESGEPLLDLESNEDIADCLLSLTELTREPCSIDIDLCIETKNGVN